MELRIILRGMVILVSLLSISSFAQNGGYAVEFDGINGYAVATMTTGNTNSTMTMEFWFARVSDQVGTQYLGDLHSLAVNNNRRVIPFISNGEIGVYAAPNTGDDNNFVNVYTGVVPPLNIWTHIAVVVNITNIKMYINGKEYVNTSSADSYQLTGTEELYIATDRSTSTFANIKVDDIRIWSIDRTQTEINANMYKELVGNEAGLLSYYKMSDGAGTALSDNQTAGTYDGTLSGGIAWQASGAFAGTRNALYFDGEDNYVDCGNGAQVQFNGMQNLTIEAWVKPTAGQWGSIISKFQHDPAHEGYSLEMYSDRRIAFLFGNNWSIWQSVNSTNPLTLNTWNHVAATYDGNAMKVYINGRLEGTYPYTNGCTDSGTPLVIGSRIGTTVFSTFFKGYIDEARVWATALTEAQLRENMCKTLVGDEAGLRAYYRIDEIAGSTTYDYTSYAANGTLTNMNTATDWTASDAFNTWIGAESADWTNSGNWTQGVPTSGQSVGIYKWDLGNEATISSTPTLWNLLISSTSSPTLSSGLAINGNLVLEKNFSLNGNNITLSSTSYLVEGSGVLSGVAGTISITKNLASPASVNVGGLGLLLSSTINLGSTTITRGHAVQSGNDNSSITRYYDITPTNNSFVNGTIVFPYLNSEFNGLTENNFVLFSSTNSGTTWTNQGGTLSAANNTVTKSGISSFSRWTIGDVTLPLNAPIPAVLAAIEGTDLSYTEGSRAVKITKTITVSDADDTNLESVAVQITGNYQNGQDELTFINQNGITGSWNTTLGKMTLTGTSSLANYQTALRAVKYTNNSTEPNTNQRVVSFNVHDGDNNSNTVTRQINVIAVNNSPSLSNIETGGAVYREGDSPITITGSILIEDNDGVNLMSGSIQISENYRQGEDELSFTDQNGITGQWNIENGTITLTGSSSIANYQTALRNMGYKNISVKPDTFTRTISFIVNDGKNNSNTLSRNVKVVSVNSAPVLQAIQDQTVYEDSSLTVILSAADVEGDSVTYTVKSDTSAVTVTLADTILTLRGTANWYGSANITIAANDGIDKDTAVFKLMVSPVNDAPEITPIADIQINEEETKEIIIEATDVEGDSLRYTSLSRDIGVVVSMNDNKLIVAPKKDWTGTTNILVTVNDGVLNTSAMLSLEVRQVNDAPVLSNVEINSLQYVIKSEGVNITDSLEVTDVDDINMASAVIIISENYQKYEDKLFFENQNGITGNWDEGSGTITLLGSATLSNYKSAISNVQYTNPFLTPTRSIRKINITVSDSESVSNTVSREIIVTGKTTAPVLSKVESEVLEFVKGDEGKVITNTIKVEDPDNKYLFEGKVSFKEGFITGEDELEFTSTSKIIGVYNSTEGKLDLKGQATVEEYQNALRTVKYKNTKGVKAETSTKKIIFTVWDGQWTSNKITCEIDIVSPIITPSNLTVKLNSDWHAVLKWEDNSNNEDGFVIGKIEDSQGQFIMLDSINANTIEYTDSDVLEGSIYTYGVLAYNNLGAISDTTSDNQGSILVPLKPPTNLKAVVNPEGKIDLSWTDNSSAEKMYLIERSEITNDNFKEIHFNRNDSCNFSDRDITNNQKYYYRVCAVKDNLKSEFSNIVEADGIVTDVTEELTGIPKEYKLYANYPNPFNPTTVIKFDIPKDGKYVIRVYNILGEVVSVLADKEYAAGCYQVTFDALNLSSGIYFYQLHSNDKNIIKKMLLVK